MRQRRPWPPLPNQATQPGGDAGRWQGDAVLGGGSARGSPSTGYQYNHYGGTGSGGSGCGASTPAPAAGAAGEYRLGTQFALGVRQRLQVALELVRQERALAPPEHGLRLTLGQGRLTLGPGLARSRSRR